MDRIANPAQLQAAADRWRELVDANGPRDLSDAEHQEIAQLSPLVREAAWQAKEAQRRQALSQALPLVMTPDEEADFWRVVGHPVDCVPCQADPDEPCDDDDEPDTLPIEAPDDAA